MKLHWWQTRWFVLAVAVFATVPLWWPTVPPLVDLPGHMGRFRVQDSMGAMPWLGHWYRFRWSLIGNLGLDLLVIPLGKIFGLELAVKLIVMAIPGLTALGLLWIAHEVHGRIPATALFALPVVYSFPFHFGFVNFALSMALALNAFALWLRMGRLGRIGLRAAVFVPISCMIWVVHVYGWGLLGVLAFSGELMRQRDLRSGKWWRDWPVAWVHAGLHCLVLALPALLMVMWRTGQGGGITADWFHWRFKILWVTMLLRDRWELFDLGCLAVLYLILFKGIRDPNIQYSRNLTLSALFLLAVYMLVPRIVFGSAYADMRLAPFMFGIALIALRPKPGLSIRGAAAIAGIGLCFFAVRIAATTASFYLYDQSYERELAALDHVPKGARLLSMVGTVCYYQWTMSRLEHLPGLALERRLAFSNDQWSMAGAQLLTTHYPAARGFQHDPSQMVTRRQCRHEFWRPINTALARFPRAAFDYVWLIDPPSYDPALTRGMTPVWRRGTSVLFRIDHNADTRRAASRPA